MNNDSRDLVIILTIMFITVSIFNIYSINKLSEIITLQNTIICDLRELYLRIS